MRLPTRIEIDLTPAHRAARRVRESSPVQVDPRCPAYMAVGAVVLGLSAPAAACAACAATSGAVGGAAFYGLGRAVQRRGRQDDQQLVVAEEESR